MPHFTLVVISPAGTATPFTVLPEASFPTPDKEAFKSVVIALPRLFLILR